MRLDCLKIALRDTTDAQMHELKDWLESRYDITLVKLVDGGWSDEKDAYFCERCETWHSDSLTTVRTARRNTQEWCEGCCDDHAFRCGDCGDWFRGDMSCGCNTNDETVCESCAESYFTCECCGHTCHNDDYGSDGRCQDCDTSSDVIQSYGTEVPCQFHGKGPHYYGVELEVEASNVQDCAERVNDIVSSWAILKEDGSLSRGFEIVTHPMSLDEHLKHWPEFFADGTRGLKSFQTQTCGLHVHCSRKPLSELTIAKIVCFVNLPANLAFMECIAGRSASKWAQYHEKKLGEAAKTNPVRYAAVNLQNDATIEFRIFKGTLKQASLFKAVEFCDALIRFCQPGARSLNDSLSLSRFLEYVSANHKAYPHLSAFIDAKWLGKETKETVKFGYTPSNQEN